jgi:hypothetical protein
MMNGLDATALGIAWREGPLRPPNRSFRNLNPGNIRNPSWPTKDMQGYDIYPDFFSGYEALFDDLQAKFTGRNSHGLGQNSTLLDLMKIYAPAEDSNDPNSYAAFLADWLTKSLNKPISLTSTLSEIWKPASF